VISYAPARAIATLMGGVSMTSKASISCGFCRFFSPNLVFGAGQFFP